MRLPSKTIVSGIVALATVAPAAGCGKDKSGNTAWVQAAPTPAASATARPAAAPKSVADRCKRAVAALNTYAGVAAKHPIEIGPGGGQPPEKDVAPVKEAAAKAVAELRIAADGATEKAVLTQLNASIDVLEETAAGEFGDDQRFLPVMPLIKACGKAAPELTKGDDLKFELNFG
ncbi:hypothetical protein [Jidongwangia harbinensis]|uniref:hypothetical protein n=1 Tax=Jidongwangia harbinensis TaxID=2878561 RepID=UPI001CD947C8|nr:hypothetical protein [Jidongwangia harbinensis]MCA2218751.1 hypothetical protein [Jidongwangia harbinensis]